MTLLEELIKYSKDIIENKIMSCKKHKWACMRFLKDIERQKTEDFEYEFVEEKAQRFLTWMTFFKHTKGVLAGKQKIPELIEKFIFGNVYGWVKKGTDIRRFRVFYWQVARKNAKSQDLAICGLYEMSALGELFSEVYVAATKKDQTRYVWGEARAISQACPELNGKIIVKYHDDLNTKVIMHPKSNSFFARLTEEDKKKGDGSNPQACFLDEYHAHPTTEYYDIATSGMKTRQQPLLGIITTAGFEFGYPCYTTEYPYASNILNPDSEIENDRYFAMINELDSDDDGNLIDDITDEKFWEKSNPISIKSEVVLESIRSELKMAQGKPEKMRDFLTKTMNVWVNQRSCGYMNLAKWKSCMTTKENDLPNISGLEATAGFDLSATIDLTSVGILVPLHGERIYVISHSFMPEENFNAKVKIDKVPYGLWREKGWITVTPGSEIDYRFVIKWTFDTFEKHGLIEKELCFDRYMATMLMQDLSDNGHTVVAIPQGIPTLSIPTKDFRAKVYDKKIIHDNNPVLNWAIGNAVTRKDHNDNIMLDKSKATERIDPIAAVLNAYVRVWLNEKAENSVYDSRPEGEKIFCM